MKNNSLIRIWLRQLNIASLLRLLIALPVAALVFISAFVIVDQQNTVSNTAKLRTFLLT
jgi:hypothetical protein